MQAISSFSFAVAGVPIVVTCHGEPGIEQRADSYQPLSRPAGSPALELHLTRVPGHFEQDAPPMTSPVFTKHARPGYIEVVRRDARGQLHMPDDPAARWSASFASARTRPPSKRPFGSAPRSRYPGVASCFFTRPAWPTSDGGAFLFAGRSGAGKPTIAQMLCAAFPNVQKLSDELLAVRQTAHGFEAHFSPFSASRGLEAATWAPLRSIQFLVQAPSHRRIPVRQERAVPELMRHVLTYAADRATAGQVLALCAELVAAVPCFWLEFARRADVGEVRGIT